MPRSPVARSSAKAGNEATQKNKDADSTASMLQRILKKTNKLLMIQAKFYHYIIKIMSRLCRSDNC
jgi:hypothetical protein